MKYDNNKNNKYFGRILQGIVYGISPEYILETGIRDGMSTNIFLNYLDDRGKLVSIDKNNDCNFLKDYQKSQNHEIIISEAIEALAKLDMKFDLIFLDDWHSKDHVLREINLCEKLMHERTLILVHDTMHGCTDPYYNTTSNDEEFSGGGPYAALQELDKKIWEYCTIPFSHGITLLRKIQ